MKSQSFKISFVLLVILISVGARVVNAQSDGDILGSYKGVVSHSNGGNISGTFWQCVEFIKRFYRDAMGVDTSGWRGNGVDYYGSASTKGLIAYPNGGTEPPRPDDILCYAGTTSASIFGHVSIVTEVSGSTVKVIEQNWSRFTCFGSVTMDNNNGHFTIRNRSSYRIQGWLRKPGPPPPCAGHEPVGQDSSEQQHFIDAYNRNGGNSQVGCSENKTHWWGGSTPVVIQDFDGGSGGRGALIDNEGTGHDTAHWVHGAIWGKYASLGGPDFDLHRPLTDEAEAPVSPFGTTGRYNRFEGGHIFHSQYGTYFTKGSINELYANLGSSGFIGFPTTDEMVAPNSIYGSDGWFQYFEGGGIYASRQRGAFEVHGGIGAKYRAFGELTGPLGFPTTNEIDAPTSPYGTRGRYNAFEGDHGIIVWSPQFGSHPIFGKISVIFGDNGGTGGRYGYPISDPYPWYGGTRVDFEGGFIAVDYTIPLTDGTLIQDANGTVYVIYGGAKFWLTLDEFNAFGFPGKTIWPVSQEKLASIPDIPKDGTLLGDSNGTAYVIYGNAKFWLTNVEFEAFGFSTGNIRPVSNRMIAQIPDIPKDGTLLVDSNGTVHVIYGGAKFWLTNVEFASLGFSGDNIRAVSNRMISQIPDVPRDGTLLVDPSGTVFVIYGGAKFALTASEYQAFGFSDGDLRRVSFRMVSQIPNIPRDGTLVRERTGTIVYIIRDGYKEVTTDVQNEDLKIIPNGGLEQIPNRPSANNAAFVTQSVPTPMTAGRGYFVSVTMKNTGSNTWTAAGRYFLGSQNPTNNTNFGTARVSLPPGVSVEPGQSYTFSFPVSVKTPGTYNFQWRMVQSDWFGDLTPNVRVAVTANGAAFVSQSVPSTMTTNHPYNVSVTMKNTGTTTWTAAGRYLLGSQNPVNSTAFKTFRVSLPLGVSVEPGESYTFSFPVTAPEAPGTYNFQWRMLQGDWFGDLTTNQKVMVTANAAAFVSQSVPTLMTAGRGYYVNVTMKNIGSATWTPEGRYLLGSQAPLNNTNFGTARVGLSPGTSVAPGQSYTFSFPVKAPETPGTYNFQWRMVQGDWFGDLTPNVRVAITANGATFVSQSVPTPMTAGRGYYVSVTMKNTGISAWTPEGRYYLGSQNPQNTTLFGTARVGLPPGARVEPGQNYTFSFPVKAPETPGTYNFQWRMVQADWFGDLTPNIRVPVTVNGAAFVSQSIPTPMTANRGYYVRVTMKNVGTSIWTSAGRFLLGSQNPANNAVFKTVRVGLPDGESVEPGESYTFSFPVQAPSTPGTYDFQWRMLQGDWFGDYTPNVRIPVTANGAAFVSQSVPTAMTAGRGYYVKVTMKNVGTSAWTPEGRYYLGSQNPQNTNVFGTARVGLPPGVIVEPGQSYTFSFPVSVKDPGSYNFQWRMVQADWFGDFTPNVKVSVAVN